MEIYERTSQDVCAEGGVRMPPCVGLTSNALPEARNIVSSTSSQTGVSTKSAFSGITSKRICSKEKVFLIGMHFALHMVERRKHMIIW